MKNYYTYIVLLLLVAFTSSVSAQYEHVQNLSEHIEKGKVRLKLKQEVFQQSTTLKSLNVPIPMKQTLALVASTV